MVKSFHIHRSIFGSSLSFSFGFVFYSPLALLGMSSSLIGLITTCFWKSEDESLWDLFNAACDLAYCFKLSSENGWLDDAIFSSGDSLELLNDYINLSSPPWPPLLLSVTIYFLNVVCVISFSSLGGSFGENSLYATWAMISYDCHIYKLYV